MCLTPCRQYEPLRNSLISWSSVRREMWVVPTVTWVCPPTVMGLWVEVNASSLTGDASSCNMSQICLSQVPSVSCTNFPPCHLFFPPMSHLSGLGGGAERWFQLLLLLLVQLREPLRPHRRACQSLAEDGVHWGRLKPGRNTCQETVRSWNLTSWKIHFSTTAIHRD